MVVVMVMVLVILMVVVMGDRSVLILVVCCGTCEILYSHFARIIDTQLATILPLCMCFGIEM
jgi:hypothetical protein